MKYAGEKNLNEIFESFINSYSERDKSVGFSNWLANRLQQEIPEMSDDLSENLSKEIIEAVAAYDQTLEELNKAVESGQSKEEWLAGSMAEDYADMSFDDMGSKLQRIDYDLNTSNTALMREIETVPDGAEMAVDTEIVDWNEYSVKKKVYDIGQQAVMLGIGAAAATIKRNVESSENTDVGDVIGQALHDGIETAKGEVKAVVAGVIKTAAEKKMADILPVDTSTDTICDLACVAVENADALLSVATGKNTMLEALDKMGRASVAAASRLGSNVLKGTLASIPVVGPVVVQFAGGLLDHIKSPKFTENVYPVVRDVARATWDGIKQTGRSIWNKLKTSVSELLNA